jgi:hypothetical protein
MNETRLPDCRPAQHDESVTRASAHPELINGDFAMRPRLHASVFHVDDTAASSWPRCLSTSFLFVAGIMLLHTIVAQPTESTAQTVDLTPSCTEWHQTASAAVTQLAESTRDSDLRQVNDVIFRMRRARRNCEEGWFRLACQDYYSVARNLPGLAGTNEESLFACRRVAS